jgi:lipid A 4'-phosphatase
MNYIGLLIALAIAVLAGLAFGLYPQLDLALMAPFYDPASGWIVRGRGWLLLRNVISWIIALIAAPAGITLLSKIIWPHKTTFIWPHKTTLMPSRAALLMLLTLALGPGLLANVILKDMWGRPRPIEVMEFGGPLKFVPWWDPRGACPKNCSFVAGEPSAAFWTLALAALAPPHWRALAYGAALAFGVAIGFLRVAAGGHFISDVVFAGVFMFLLIWIMHGLFYRWRTSSLISHK